MDPVTIATAAVAFLSPYLLEGGKAAAKKAGESLIAALERRFKDKPVPETALKDLQADPQDPDNQAALRKELKKSLAADADFMAAVTRLLEQAEAEAAAAGQQISLTGSGAIAVGNGAVAAGAGGVAVGGDVKGSITTGDHVGA
ncbi:MAG: hypothetical protein B6I35_09760 [Anaerolineaceae bacterium 4572_32.2]|nr:MAG: hypothetical protein B6I35_09760 [Anaerolineaceae bacterium 4572_32.2]